MSNELVLPEHFNLSTATKEILNLKINVGNDLIKLGKWLTYVKEGIPKNEWMSWLKNDVHIPYVQAYRYIKISQEVDAGTIDRIGYTKVSEILELPASRFREDLLSLASGLSQKDIREIKNRALHYQEEQSKKASRIIDEVQNTENMGNEALDMLVGSLDMFHNLDISQVQPYFIDLLYSQLINAHKKIEGILKTLNYVKAKE